MIPQIPETMGLKLTKHSPPLYQVYQESYQRAIDWYRRQLLDHGIDATEAVLDPYLERWVFYERGKAVLILEHAMIDRVYGLLVLKEFAPDKG